MIGDGVNDILGPKIAQFGISMETGSGASRAVTGVVLLDDRPRCCRRRCAAMVETFGSDDDDSAAHLRPFSQQERKAHPGWA
jgi:hypothetical protein